MKMIFALVKVPEQEKVNIGTFYLTSEADKWWSTVKDIIWLIEFTQAKFLEELRVKFYPINYSSMLKGDNIRGIKKCGQI